MTLANPSLSLPSFASRIVPVIVITTVCVSLPSRLSVAVIV